MWAYRLSASRNFYGMTRSVDSLRKAIREAHDVSNARFKKEWESHADDGDIQAPADTPYLFDRDVTIAKNMARTLGWDMSLYNMSCFLLPGPDSFLYGFIITQATSGQRYVISPAPLAYLDEHIDWDAHTSTDEVRDTRHALDGTMPGPPPIQMTDWKVSRRGNQYCHINGAQVTIFPDTRSGGYKAIIASPNDLKVFTHSFQSELGAAEYVVKNFYTLIKEWGLGVPSCEPNPFEGIDWSDDDDNGTTHPPDDDIPF